MTGPFYRIPYVYEPFSAFSHLGGAAVFLVLGVLLVRKGRGDPLRVTVLSVYAVSCVFLLTASGVYHMMSRGSTAREVLERIDHAAIFVLITGTATPVYGILFHGRLRWGLLLFMWACTAAGVTLKTVFFRDVPEWLGIGMYLALGWVAGGSMVVLARRHGLRFVQPGLIGGLAYTLGAVIEFQRWPVLAPGVVHSHELFHVAVLVGVASHWLFIWQFADGVVRVPRGGRPPA